MKKSISLIAFLLVFSACSSGRVKNTVPEGGTVSYGNAVNLWIDGDRDKALSALSGLCSAGKEDAVAACLDASALCSESGDNRSALKYADAAAALDKSGFDAQFERGFNLLCMDKPKKAVSAFKLSLPLTASNDMLSRVYFYTALADAREGNTAEALDNMRRVFIQQPYLLSLSSQMIAMLNDNDKNRKTAMYFVNQALEYDEYNLPAMELAADMYYKKKQYFAAWQLYQMQHYLDPYDSEANLRIKDLDKRLEKTLGTGAADMMFWQRLTSPLHKSVYKDDSPSVRLALYSAPKTGRPAALKSFALISNSPLEIYDGKLGLILTGKKNSMWTFEFDGASGAVRITDNLSAVVRDSVNDIMIKPSVAGAVTLVKDPSPASFSGGVNLSDKEIAGDIKLEIRNGGMELINTTPLEALVSPVASGFISRSNVFEFAKAASVAVRTRLLRISEDMKKQGLDYDLCDSSYCLEFKGLQNENQFSSAGARATRGEILSDGDGSPADVRFHFSCGGVNDAGLSDWKDGRGFALTPYSIYKRVLTSPSEDLMCQPADETRGSEAAWTLILPADKIEERLNRDYSFGKLKNLIPMKRDGHGRVLTLSAVGSKKTVLLEGFSDISWYLDAGTLRSQLFVIRPLGGGFGYRAFMITGLGTGDGKGMCLAGARGYADAGNDYRKVLGRYYPGLSLTHSAGFSEPEQVEKPAAPVPLVKTENKIIRADVSVKTGENLNGAAQTSGAGK